jgi:aldehyde:ferredoxin oxidoreductase
MANGYTGKILRVNLSTQNISTIPTSRYEQWVGGHGMCSAIFWDLCKDKTVSGRDPGNVITIMTSPLTGTQAPSAGRTELTGIGIESYPIEWYNRSNFGGRFGAMLKMAGWDGIVIEGKANALCWLKIVDDKVTLEDAKAVKGMDCWDTQTYLWALHNGDVRAGQWQSNSTQRPAILCISAAGEAGSRMACLIHDAGNAAGEGGFGGVFGSKNLKAISVMGTGSFEIADPKALMDARLWLKDIVIPVPADSETNPTFRASGCVGCPIPCRQRNITNTNNDSQCTDTYWYAGRSLIYANPKMPLIEQQRATDLAQRYGINVYHNYLSHQYLSLLFEAGILGSGKPIPSAPLKMESYGTLGFAEEFLKAITSQQGIGAALSEGAPRSAKQWGRLEEDLETGLLQYPQWGYPWHSSTQPCWGLPSILGERDVNEHTLRTCWPTGNLAKTLPAEKLAEMVTQKFVPYAGDPLMINYSDGADGIYSEHWAKMIAWHRHYGRFWKQSVLYCDQSNFIPSFMAYTRNKRALTPEAEPKFFNPVTGKNISFTDGMELGRKIWNLDKAIWVLQGRHRDQEKFAPFMHKTGASYGGCGTTKIRLFVAGANAGTTNYPVCVNGKWGYNGLKEFYYQPAGVEAFKTAFYKVEGWDTHTGWPTRATLEQLGLKYVADELAAKGKLPG